MTDSTPDLSNVGVSLPFWNKANRATKFRYVLQFLLFATAALVIVLKIWGPLNDATILIGPSSLLPLVLLAVCVMLSTKSVDLVRSAYAILIIHILLNASAIYRSIALSFNPPRNQLATNFGSSVTPSAVDSGSSRFFILATAIGLLAILIFSFLSMEFSRTHYRLAQQVTSVLSIVTGVTFYFYGNTTVGGDRFFFEAHMPTALVDLTFGIVLLICALADKHIYFSISAFISAVMLYTGVTSLVRVDSSYFSAWLLAIASALVCLISLGEIVALISGKKTDLTSLLSRIRNGPTSESK
jgi:hypothetical protein